MFRSWVKEALRGGAASLIAPGILLAAAVVVAVGGGGTGALSSLDQLTSGPEAPAPAIESGSTAGSGPSALNVDGQAVGDLGTGSLELSGRAARLAAGLAPPAEPAAAAGSPVPAPFVVARRLQAPAVPFAVGAPDVVASRPVERRTDPGPQPPGGSAGGRPAPAGSDVVDQTSELGEQVPLPLNPLDTLTAPKPPSGP